MSLETEVLPGSASPQVNNDLPESAKLKAAAPSIDDYFKDESPTPNQAPAARSEAPAEPVVAEPLTGIAARLAAKGKPVAPAVPVEPVAPVDPVEVIETQMRAANKNWKPSEGWNNWRFRALSRILIFAGSTLSRKPPSYCALAIFSKRTA